jgi:type VI protein secretion system component Hcp
MKSIMGRAGLAIVAGCLAIGTALAQVQSPPAAKIPVPAATPGPTAAAVTAPFMVELEISGQIHRFPAISLSSPGAPATATPQKQHTPMKPVRITRHPDASSPLLRQALTRRKSIASMTITKFNKGKAVLQLVYTNAFVTSMKDSADPKNQPLEAVTFAYEQVKEIYNKP